MYSKLSVPVIPRIQTVQEQAFPVSCSTTYYCMLNIIITGLIINRQHSREQCIRSNKI